MPEELAEGAESVELDKSVGDILEEVSVLIGFEELAEGARSVELDESVRDMLEEVSVLVEDKESTNVLVTLETLVSVELTEMRESELVGELAALVEESVRKLDVVALTLEGPVLDTLSVVDEMEVTADELKDDTPPPVELEINEVAEDGLELVEDIEDGLEEMIKELVMIEDWLSPELVEGSNVLEKVEPLSVLKIEVLGSAELDEPLSELEIALVDAGADEEVIVTVELIGEEIGPALDISELNMELVLGTTELELPVVVVLLVLEITELELLDGGKVLILDVAEFELLIAGVELEVILDIIELELPIIVELLALEMIELELLDGGEVLILDVAEFELLNGDVELEVILDIMELVLLAICDVLEINIVVEEACADDILEDGALLVLLDVELGIFEVVLDMLLDAELGVLEIPLELLLLDAVLLWRDVDNDIGVDLELEELAKEANIDDEMIVSFPSVA